MDREDLLTALETVAPALSTNNLIPVLQHFWFTGKRVMAYNDQIAISTPLQTDFKGAVPGAILMDILRTISAHEVRKGKDGKETRPILFEVEDSTLHIKVSGRRGDYKLGLLPPSSFEPLFQMPPFKEGMVTDQKVFLAGIRNCNRSVSNDTSVPEQLGITVVVGDKEFDLYSTSNETLSHSKAPMQQKPKFKRVILSGPFCKQVAELAGKADKTEISIHSDHSLFKADDTMLFGRLIAPHESADLDFKGILEHHLPRNYEDNVWGIPERMKNIIDRACIISSATIDQTRTKVTLNGSDYLRFYSKSTRGEAQDDLNLKTVRPTGKQGEVTIHLDPELLKAGLEGYQRILFTDDCVILTDEKHKHLYLVGASKR